MGLLIASIPPPGGLSSLEKKPGQNINHVTSNLRNPPWGGFGRDTQNQNPPLEVYGLVDTCENEVHVSAVDSLHCGCL